MRIAIISHPNYDPEEVQFSHVLGLYVEAWRAAGHEVRYLLGCREFWPADVAILHVDLSVVPARFLEFARRYPVALNAGIPDIRKRVLSRNLLSLNSEYDGPVIVKSDLNASGVPEHVLHYKYLVRNPRTQAHFEAVLEPPSFVQRLLERASLPFRGMLKRPPQRPRAVKEYAVYDSVADVPPEVWNDPDLVVERFRPERDGEWYITRRCAILGDRAITYLMADTQPIVDVGDLSRFSWIETPPEIPAFAKEMGLDYGVIDFTVDNDEIVILDVNKTPGYVPVPGRGVPPTYARIVAHNAPGIETFASVTRDGAFAH